MKPRLVVAVSAWILAPVLAAAQIKIAAPAAEAGGSAAAAGAVSISAARTIPVALLAIGYAHAINSPTPALSAGAAFLADAPARQWLSENRPAQYPTLVRDAFKLSDWQEILSSFDDARQLLEAVLARKNDAFEKNPAALLALVDRTPALAARRRFYETAVLDWGVIGADSRAALAADGAPESVWSDLSVTERFQKLRDVYAIEASRMITVPVGNPEYPAQFEAALMRRSMLMSNVEFMHECAALERLKRMNAALRQAEEAAAASADATAAALLESARTATNFSSAESLLDAASRRLGLAPAPSEPTGGPPLDAAEREAIAARLDAALAVEISGTPLGAKMLAAVAGDRIDLRLEDASAQAAAHYDPMRRRIVISIGPFTTIVSELGLTPRELMTDDDAVARVAAVYSSVIVHEMTHHFQREGDYVLPVAVRHAAFNRQREVEATLTQAVFLRQKRSSDPGFAALEADLLKDNKLAGRILEQPENLTRNPARMARWLEIGYSRVPTLSRAAALIVDHGIAEDRKNADQLRLIEQELARRRLVTRDERAYLGIGSLRRMRAKMQGGAHAMVLAADALVQRTHDSLRALERALQD